MRPVLLVLGSGTSRPSFSLEKRSPSLRCSGSRPFSPCRSDRRADLSRRRISHLFRREDAPRYRRAPPGTIACPPRARIFGDQHIRASIFSLFCHASASFFCVIRSRSSSLVNCRQHTLFFFFSVTRNSTPSKTSLLYGSLTFPGLSFFLFPRVLQIVPLSSPPTRPWPPPPLPSVEQNCPFCRDLVFSLER